ncbi:hypothetical protein [Burkholderia pyrrocinia]|uniref:hypothetical protein n=1 Tax=Burkholderia pyrrocinia TaxID=60550 RepID=UPI00064C2F9F|nr:hypothetical protein [Burkholderia pyrrocinia]AKM01799.1 hypothetical protein ABD05_11705 [Burkholderia pyrrocinia]
MSRWLNNPLAVGIGTREIVVGVRSPALWRPRKRAFAADPVSVAIPDAQFGSEAGVLDALRAALAATVATSGGAADAAVTHGHARSPMSPTRGAHVVLDDFWCHHAILRGDFRALRMRELEEIVLAHFSDTYGVDGASLVVRFCVQQRGRALFAGALSRTLHDGIHDAAASARVRVCSLRSGLPETLNRIAVKAGDDALLIVVADALMQAVMIERGGWAAYDAQRLFPGESGDASRLTELAEQLFERSATRAGMKREDCPVYLIGIDTDFAPFGARFAAAVRLPGPALDGSPASRLMEYAP